jgi:hypothetical protein
MLAAFAHRQYDYPSLSRNIIQNTGWLNGCNFIINSHPLIFPNSLFEERLDGQAGSRYDIPSTSFTVTAHKEASALKIAIAWDAKTWTITPKEMMTEFKNTSHEFLNIKNTVNTGS